MKESWKTYFSEIGLPEKLVEIIEKKSTEVINLCNVELEDVFVSNVKKAEGIEYTSVWFFSTDEKAIECKNFITEDNYDMICLHKNVAYFNIVKKELDDISVPTDKSSVVVNCYIRGVSMTCDFSAIGINCKYLVALSRKYYSTNIAAEPI